MSDKAQLHLLDGKKTLDLAALVKLFEKLTGRAPTPDEIAEAKEQLKEPS